jgi:hypothetical protein
MPGERTELIDSGGTFHRLGSRLTLLLLLGLAAGCTTVGVHTKERTRVDYGPPATLRVCLLVNEGVAPQRATELIAAVNKEFEPYGINVVVPWTRPWSRPGFEVSSIMQELTTHPLEPPCDRLVGLVSRNAGDFLWGLVLPEVLGAVDENTHTHGYIVANYGSVNQIFAQPDEGAVHEFYHLLGCEHDLAMTRCYHEIAAMKAQIAHSVELFPGRDGHGNFLLTRTAVNDMLLAEHSTIVRVCLNEQGGLSQPPVVQHSSGDKQLDAAALDLASKTHYTAAAGEPLSGCRSVGIRMDRQGQPTADHEALPAAAPP